MMLISGAPRLLPTDGFVAQDLYCAVMGFLWHYEGCAAAAVSEARRLP
jgi:hypothetical protein